MDMIGKVRRMKLRDKLSKSAIAKLTGLSRNTVKKWLKAAGDVAPKYRRTSPDGKLSAFKATLETALTADAHRPKHARRTGKALFEQIQAKGRHIRHSGLSSKFPRISTTLTPGGRLPSRNRVWHVKQSRCEDATLQGSRLENLQGFYTINLATKASEGLTYRNI